MGENIKRRRSLWDVDTEKQLDGHDQVNENKAWGGRESHSGYESGHYQKWPGSQDEGLLKSQDHSRVPFWKSGIAQKSDNVNKDEKDLQQKKEQDKDASYYHSMSPAFDRWAKQNHSRSPDSGWTQSRRYAERGRSKSRSRSRSRSRSLSRGRGWDRDRDRGRGRAWSKSKSKSRSRSRSRSGSRSRGSARGWARSRSPLRDYKRDPYGWSDRRSGSGTSPQACRDFTMGKCRRGSQCRFLHSDNHNNRNADSSEATERWRSRPEIERSSRYANSKGAMVQSWDKAPETVHGEGESVKNRSRSTICCKDFVKGKCQRGASCRFSHNATPGDNYDQGIKNALSNDDLEHQPSRTGRPFCKYFAAGNCYRENCRFSHDGPPPSSFEGRAYHEVENDSDKNKWLSFPSWGEAGRASNPEKLTGWGDNAARMDHAETVAISTWGDAGRPSNLEKVTGWGENAMRMDHSERVANDRTDERWSHSLESDIRAWGNLEENEKVSERGGKYLSSLGKGDDSCGNFGTFVPQSYKQGASENYISVAAAQPKVSADSYTQQQHEPVENRVLETCVSQTVAEANLNGEKVKPSAFTENIQSVHVVFPVPSDGRNINLNEPGTHVLSPSYLENQRQSILKPPEMLELKDPQVFSNVVNSEQLAQIIQPSASLTGRSMIEQTQTLLPAILNSISTGIVPLTSSSAFVPPSNTISSQPNQATGSLDQYDRAAYVSEPNTSCTKVARSDSLFYSTGQKKEIPLEETAQVSKGDKGYGDANLNGSSNVEYQEIPETKQQGIAGNSEINDHKKAADKCKVGEENIRADNVGDKEKNEEGSNKDEKGMRLFKIALIEFVKEILKPTWKEGKLSREVHKTIVKKAVDKVTSTISGDHVPRTQDKIDQYLSFSKSKITKLVQAYVERFLKTDS